MPFVVILAYLIGWVSGVITAIILMRFGVKLWKQAGTTQ